MRVFSILLSLFALLLAGACGSDAGGPAGTPIDPNRLSERIERGEAPLVLDVRTPEEFARGHIPGALNVPHDEIPGRIAELPAGPRDEIVVHCHSGRRAAIAEETLRGLGYSNLRTLEGHWQAWDEAGLPKE